MSVSEIETRVRYFIHEQFPVPDELPAEESLLESGIIDSIGVLTLVTWLDQVDRLPVSPKVRTPGPRRVMLTVMVCAPIQR